MRSPKRPRKVDRRTRRGFSLLEALIAAAVLGIGLIALVKLHTSALRGMRTTRDQASASDIATQIADYIATQQNVTPPACDPPSGPDPGCRVGGAESRDFTAVRGAGCTDWYEGAPIPDARGQLPGSAPTLAAATQQGYPYRVDRVVLTPTNPTNDGVTLDTANHVTVDGFAPPYILQVYVCWRDDQNYVRQIMTSRYVFSGPT
jgi:prepilin-type N-terminal cleavage/methylation domain-containing protein